MMAPHAPSKTSPSPVTLPRVRGVSIVRLRVTPTPSLIAASQSVVGAVIHHRIAYPSMAHTTLSARTRLRVLARAAWGSHHDQCTPPSGRSVRSSASPTLLLSDREKRVLNDIE